jgi:hypothetical protein
MIKVGQKPPQPTFGDVHRSTTLSFAPNNIFGLPLGPNENNRPAVLGGLVKEFGRLDQAIAGLGQVKNMDTLFLGIDKGLHPWMPTLSLMPKMDPSIQQFL